MNVISRTPLRTAILLGLSVAVPLTGGCSAFQSRTQRVTIIPSDASAQVYLNNA